MPKLYLLEDDENIREIVLYAFRGQGWDAEGFETPEAFWAALGSLVPDLILLDILLPDEDGLSVLRRLRRQEAYKRLPVMMLTARAAEMDKIRGLDMGADDYITKPFSMLELLSRAKALLRRAPAQGEAVLAYQGLCLDAARRRVTVKGADIALTHKEFELLHYMLANHGLALSREMLLEAVWGYETQCESRTVDMHVKSLRRKLGPQAPEIETLRGVGYRL